MARTYFPAVGDDWEISPLDRVSMDVIEGDREPRFSGLYDANGNRMMVRNEREPIGFVRFPPKG